MEKSSSDVPTLKKIQSDILVFEKNLNGFNFNTFTFNPSGTMLLYKHPIDGWTVLNCKEETFFICKENDNNITKEDLNKSNAYWIDDENFRFGSVEKKTYDFIKSEEIITKGIASNLEKNDIYRTNGIWENGSMIAYQCVDYTKVPEFSYEDETYNGLFSFNFGRLALYKKTNPTTSIIIHDTNKNKEIMNIPMGDDHYIIDALWYDKSRFIVQYMNRELTTFTIDMYDFRTKTMNKKDLKSNKRQIYTKTSDSSIALPYYFWFTKINDTDYFMIVEDVNDDPKINQLLVIQSINDDNNERYEIEIKESSIKKIHFANQIKDRKFIVCYTISTNEHDVSLVWMEINVNKKQPIHKIIQKIENSDLVIMNSDKTKIVYRKMYVNQRADFFYFDLNHDKRLHIHYPKFKSINLKELGISSFTCYSDQHLGYQATYGSFMNDQKIQLTYQYMKPNEGKGPFPVIVFVYGGPGLQSVMKDYTNFSGRDYLSMILVKLGFVVIRCDNRGTPHRGGYFRKEFRDHVGKIELEDQIKCLLHLQPKLNLDLHRVGIIGCSYGGYLASMGVIKYPDIFKVGVSVSGCTNWDLYDSLFTERIFTDPMKAKKASVITQLKKRGIHKDNGLMIIHGQKDENVCVQHVKELVDQLNKYDVVVKTVDENANHKHVYGSKNDPFCKVLIYKEKGHGFFGFNGNAKDDCDSVCQVVDFFHKKLSSSS